MADLTSRIPGCDDCEGERGERGERGHRGHRGHDGHDGRDGDTGPTGPTGPTGSAGSASGLLKFSGDVAVDPLGTTVGHLADAGIGNISGPGSMPYPVAVAHSLRNLAVILFNYTVQANQSIVIELLRTGVPEPGFTITFGPGEGPGVKSVLAGPAAFAMSGPAGPTFDLQVTTTNIDNGGFPISLSATIGIE